MRNYEINRLEISVAGGFKTQDGPFVKTLDTALASFNVHRQAYYSGTFVGNHVHRTLGFVYSMYLRQAKCNNYVENIIFTYQLCTIVFL